ncbi:MAG: P-II family nitrogen regulator [Nitrosopumilaceae archaeon]|nr:P-II family nitrogen regulator [Nitrosopumilaceae archaeon]NIU00427.1 P-II family nitrogen regulator [Nitrosopumilaceae archaeon]NIU87104.1 P-II family nitrogen regulator [Nitrosopumilaceae archaeon]NIV65659.1 P-II family nitrogen regulator [Nitrosopumilaceae archaeon]NIX61029.1 P-II family nitrogen regulator [Nitrosopumilaceae archaeon]
MKRIEALVPSDRLREVREAIKNSGASGLYITSGKGQGAGDRPMVGGARGTGRHTAEYNSIEAVVTVVDDSIADKVTDAIVEAASSGNKGDGKIFVTNIDGAIDIGSKKKGGDAL